MGEGVMGLGVGVGWESGVGEGVEVGGRWSSDEGRLGESSSAESCRYGETIDLLV